MASGSIELVPTVLLSPVTEANLALVDMVRDANAQHKDEDSELFQQRTVQTLQVQAWDGFVANVLAPREEIAAETLSYVATREPNAVMLGSLQSKLFSPYFNPYPKQPSPARQAEVDRYHAVPDLNEYWAGWCFGKLDDVAGVTVRTLTDIYVGGYHPNDEITDAARTLNDPTYDKPGKRSKLLGLSTERAGWGEPWHYDPARLREVLGSVALARAEDIYAESRAHIVGEPESSAKVLYWARVRKTAFDRDAYRRNYSYLLPEHVSGVLHDIALKKPLATLDEKEFISEATAFLQEKATPNEKIEASFRSLSIINGIVRASQPILV